MFLRWKLANSNYFCVPLMVKAFVAPLKKKSIPRLELMGIFIHIQVGMERTSCKPSEWSSRKPYSIRETSIGRHFHESVIHGGTVENTSCRSDLFGKQPASLSQFRQNLGKPSSLSKRPSYWPPFSASRSRTRRESESAASHAKH